MGQPSLPPPLVCQGVPHVVDRAERFQRHACGGDVLAASRPFGMTAKGTRHARVTQGYYILGKGR